MAGSLCVDRVWRPAPTTFRTKRDAEAFLAATRADIERETWIPPEQGRIRLRYYSKQWLDQKPNLRPRSREQYDINWRLHILPTLGDTDLSRISPSMVRAWRADLLSKGRPGHPTVAKCNRLLHAILATAVEDELIPKNPCSCEAHRPISQPSDPSQPSSRCTRSPMPSDPRSERWSCSPPLLDFDWANCEHSGDNEWTYSTRPCG